MGTNNDGLRKRLFELRDTVMEEAKDSCIHYYDRIENFIGILEYCILNLNSETYHTIMMIKDFIVEKYSFLLDEYEDLADEIFDKRHEKEDKELLEKLDNPDEDDNNFEDMDIFHDNIELEDENIDYEE